MSTVKLRVLEAFEHHQTTIGRILQDLDVPRSPGRPPLVEIIFNVDRDPAAAAFAGVDFSYQRNPKRALHYDLFLNFVEGPGGLYLECDYNEDLFDADTMSRWLGHFNTLLSSVVANPSESVSRMAILDDAERTELIRSWNDTEMELPPGETVLELFERQVETRPHERAVTCGEDHLTYEQLNRRANHIAHRLGALGAGPDVIVGLCLERSLDMVAGVLGILKAGSAYLPMDIGYPADRLKFMLEDARAPVVLTQRRLIEQLPKHPGTTLCVEDLQDGLDTNPVRSATPSNLAYVIYTSGSTGRPKGVLLEHRGLLNVIRSVTRTPGFSDRDVMCAVTTLSFDIATAELLLPLTNGGRLVVATRDVAVDGGRLAEMLERTGATFMQPTPVTWQMLLDSGWQGNRDLKMVSTGEPLPRELAARLLPKGQSLWNLYGPTETTIWSTGAEITSAQGAISIGRPIANTQTYILDNELQPVPVGVVGELFIGGDGLARGYLNLPELSAEKFVRNPFVLEDPSARLYRTGDLARYRRDSSIECLGRIDHQVKLRGFRIELGEIEAALDGHPGVGRSVVLARESRSGERILVAYFESGTGSTPAESELLSYLRKTLPEHMVPSTFVKVDRLPLTPSGKIDRNALPSPEEVGRISDRAFVAPGSLEQMLAQIWSKVLKVSRIGADDNFFHLGGHSILAVRVLMDVEKQWGQRLPLATLLEAPTIGGLAEVLRRADWKPKWTSLVPVQPAGARPPLFLMHSHGGNVLEYYGLVSHLDNDQPVYALQARGLDGRIPIDQSLEEMASAYLLELRQLQPQGPYFLGGFCFGGLLALEAAQQLTAAGEEVALVALLQTTHAAANGFKPGTTRLQRWWYRATKRFDLERENFRRTGKAYLSERAHRTWDVVRSRTEMRLESITGTDRHSRSMPYVLEALSIEHDRVFEQYVPRRYEGPVVLLRARKQLQGRVADPETLGWKGMFDGDFEVYEVPGHQQNMLLEPNVQNLARELTVRLIAAQDRASRR